jgi:hypothetical protein
MSLKNLFKFEVSDVILEFLEINEQENIISSIDYDNIELVYIKSSYFDYLTLSKKQKYKVKQLYIVIDPYFLIPICRKVSCLNIIVGNSLTELNIDYSLVEEIPDTLINLVKLECFDTPIFSISDKFINLKYLNCCQTTLIKIPDTYINLEYLNCSETLILDIPDTLVNLVTLNCHSTCVSSISNKLLNLIDINCTYTLIREKTHPMIQRIEPYMISEKPSAYLRRGPIPLRSDHGMTEWSDESCKEYLRRNGVVFQNIG